MKYSAAALLCFVAFCACKKSEPEGQNTGTLPDSFFEIEYYSLEITINGFENNDGQCVIAVFDSEESYDADEPILGLFEPVANGSVVLQLDSLTEGYYGISCFHDENENDELDTGFFGIPQEGFGFSNNPKITFSQPGFDDIKFQVIEPVEIVIDLQHF